MKRVVDDHFGGPEVLRVVEDDDSRPGPGEVCIVSLTTGCRAEYVLPRPVGSAWVGPAGPA